MSENLAKVIAEIGKQSVFAIALIIVILLYSKNNADDDLFIREKLDECIVRHSQLTTDLMTQIEDLKGEK